MAAKLTPDQIIDQARDAHDAAAQRIWERDGCEDAGSCGGYILILDARSPVAKRLRERGLGHAAHPGVSVCFPMPADIRSQNADIPDAAGRAAKAVFEQHGVRVQRAWSYTD